MIVIGNPGLVVADGTSSAGGSAASVARAARAVDADVQLVGKVGEDPNGDAVLIDLAKAGIGHVAVLRDPRLATPRVENPVEDMTDVDDVEGDGVRNSPADPPIDLDAADIELALRYLPDYRVIVVAEPLNEAALRAVAASATWSNAALVVVLPPGSSATAAVPDTATVLESPGDESDAAFTAMVGRYAAALDRGEDPATSFKAAMHDAGWSAAASPTEAERI